MTTTRKWSILFTTIAAGSLLFYSLAASEELLQLKCGGQKVRVPIGLQGLTNKQLLGPWTAIQPYKLLVSVRYQSGKLARIDVEHHVGGDVYSSTNWYSVNYQTRQEGSTIFWSGTSIKNSSDTMTGQLGANSNKLLIYEEARQNQGEVIQELGAVCREVSDSPEPPPVYRVYPGDHSSLPRDVDIGGTSTLIFAVYPAPRIFPWVSPQTRYCICAVPLHGMTASLA